MRLGKFGQVYSVENRGIGVSRDDCVPHPNTTGEDRYLRGKGEVVLALPVEDSQPIVVRVGAKNGEIGFDCHANG